MKRGTIKHFVKDAMIHMFFMSVTPKVKDLIFQLLSNFAFHSKIKNLSKNIYIPKQIPKPSDAILEYLGYEYQKEVYDPEITDESEESIESINVGSSQNIVNADSIRMNSTSTLPIPGSLFAEPFLKKLFFYAEFIKANRNYVAKPDERKQFVDERTRLPNFVNVVKQLQDVIRQLADPSNKKSISSSKGSKIKKSTKKIFKKKKVIPRKRSTRNKQRPRTIAEVIEISDPEDIMETKQPDDNDDADVDDDEEQQSDAEDESDEGSEDYQPGWFQCQETLSDISMINWDIQDDNSGIERDFDELLKEWKFFCFVCLHIQILCKSCI